MKYFLNQQKHHLWYGANQTTWFKKFILKAETDKSEQAIELKIKG